MSENLTGYPSIDKPWRKYYSEEELSIQIPEMSLTDYLHSKNKSFTVSNAFRRVKMVGYSN